MNQQTLFETNTGHKNTEEVMMHALGEFQSRGFVLAERELPLDRLLGAIKRAAEHFEVAEMSDDEIAESLEKLGAKISKLPSFVAKHPFRITINQNLAEKSRLLFEESNKKSKNL